jgi:hypothetical protein
LCPENDSKDIYFESFYKNLFHGGSAFRVCFFFQSKSAFKDERSDAAVECFLSSAQYAGVLHLKKKNLSGSLKKYLKKKGERLSEELGKLI